MGYGAARFPRKRNSALLTKGILGGMIRQSKAPAGRSPVLCALAVGVVLAGTAAPAWPQARTSSTRPAAALSGPLSLETATPLAVPPPPRLNAPRTIAAPPRFVAPQPLEAPPPPDVAALDPVPPPALPAGAPPIPQPARPAPAETAAAPPPAGEPAPALDQSAHQPPGRPAETRTETAALPPPPDVTALPPPEDYSIAFAGSATVLPEEAERQVEATALRLRADERLRLQLRSYASGTAETEREARRLSLQRALALRERLAALGVRSTRVDIRALGTGTGDGATDRIEVEYLND